MASPPLPSSSFGSQPYSPRSVSPASSPQRQSTTSPVHIVYPLLDGEANSSPPPRFSFVNKELAVSVQENPPWISWREVWTQCRLAGPLILGNLLSFLLQLISTTFVGHTGSLELSSAALAYSFSVVTGYSVLMGLGGALETLCGQAFGAGEYRKVGIYMQRAMVVLTLVAVPIAILWVFMEQIFLAVGQDAQLASKAGAYGVWLIPGLFSVGFYIPLVKFLQTQSLVVPLFGCFTLTLIFHVPICWFLVFHTSLGYRGAAIANSISVWITVLSLALYVRFSPKCAASRAPLSLEAVKGLSSYLKLGVPSALMTCLEWWSYEILVFISGFLLNPELQTGIIAICVNSESLLYMIPAGLAAAVSTRVSNELGANNPQAARQALNVARMLGVVEAFLVIVFLFSVRNVWGQLYSSDKEVVVAIAGYIPFFATSCAFDALQTVLSGVVRGAGWQEAGAYMNLASFYIAGLPTGCLLAFVAGLEGKGLWMGLIVGVMVQFVAYVLLICYMDFEREAKKAAARVGASSPALQPLLTSP
ncbi:hypothetical protein GOP47_0014611 [Adiantum capillus-veneris]|uniref:Protein DETOXIFICATION n=1 Tax=Adiantum capillus-veneris TaxID=13818 RepID=A0A9D4ZCB8_ADICA|nr:hypothetical protein GOP47_0014611 [Adiantum capillus-veneris]